MTSILKLQKSKWDRWAIVAELRRRGHRFKDLAGESGFSASSLRAALVKPSTNVNRFIAELLKTPVHELWPDWFDEDGELIPARYRAKLSRQRRLAASQESRAA